MIKKILSSLAIIVALGFSGVASAQNLYVQPSIGASVVNNATTADWAINKTLDQQYSLAIGKDISPNFAVEEQTVYAKVVDQSVVLETINLKVGILPLVYVKAGVGLGGVPSETTYGLAYRGSIGTTSLKPIDLSVGVVNASKVGITNQLVVSVGLKID